VNQSEGSSKAEHLVFVERKNGENPKEKWVRAWGFDENAIRESAFLNVQLGTITIEHPIIVS